MPLNNQECEFPNSVPEEVLVSVTIITYNHAPYVRQAIEGALMQETDFPYEVCIGEDDSTDGTREICIEYAKKYPEKIRLFLRSDADKIYLDGKKTGKYNSRMTVAACRGKYLASCEGDDYWIDPRKLQLQVDAMEADPRISICATRVVVKHEGDRAHVPDRLNKILSPDGCVTAEKFLYGYRINTCSRIVRRQDLVGAIDWASEFVGGDLAGMLSLVKDGNYCKVLNKCTAVYRVHGKGAWSGRNVSSVEQLDYMLRFLIAAKPHVSESIYRHLDACIVRYQLGVHFHSRQWLKFIKLAIISLPLQLFFVWHTKKIRFLAKKYS